MYKRLGSRNGSLQPQESPLMVDMEADPNGTSSARRGKYEKPGNGSRWLVLCMLVGTLVLLVMRKSILATIVNDYEVRNAEVQAATSSSNKITIAGGIDVGALLAQQEAFSERQATILNTPAPQKDNEAVENIGEQQQEADEATEEAQEEADKGSLDWSAEENLVDPKEILVEPNDQAKFESLPKQANVDWDSNSDENLSKRQMIMKEFGITLNSPFHSVQELRDLIGPQCPPLRHCSVKHSKDHMLGGGDWVNGIFHPHNCWMYNFNGNEVWTRADDVQRMIVLVDGSGSQDKIMAEIASASDLFHVVEAEMPSGSDGERSFAQRINAFVKEYARAPRVDLTLVVNWRPMAGKEVGFGRLMLRITGQIYNAETINMVYTNIPYDSLETVDEVVTTNEGINKFFQMAYKLGMNSHVIKRQPAKGMMRGPQVEARQFQKSWSAVQGVLDEYVLLDVRMAGQNNGAGFFGQVPSIKLPMARIDNGWSPNVPIDTKILVYCNKGVASLRATKLLRQYGFKNVFALQGGTDNVPPQQLKNVEKQPVRILRHASVFGVDAFAPSMNLLDDEPLKNPVLPTHLANHILNVAYKNEIVGSAEGPKSNHICQSSADCTPCLRVISRMPSTHITFEVIKTYLTNRVVPTVIKLSEDQKIWSGTWQDFLKQNKETQLTVRRNYSTVRTRRFEKQNLAEYLQTVNILKKTGDGEFEEVTEPPPAAEGGLPLYAGNNKLNHKDMQDYNFKYPDWIRVSSFQRPSMWLGPTGSFSGLHVDHTNGGNLAYQVLGAKQWHLYPPRSQPFMYLRKVGVVLWSPIMDTARYDKELAGQFPLFKLALCDAMDVEIDEGNLLWNPDQIGHDVLVTRNSLMINYWIHWRKQLLPGQQQQQQQTNPQ